MNVTEVPVRLVCGGCGWSPAGRDIAFRCALAGDGRDHALIPRVDPARVSWPAPGDPDPFVRYGSLLVARTGAVDDGEWVRRTRALAARVRSVDGRDVAPTRTVALDPDTTAKVEAEGVGGSHKWRHLFSTLLALPDDDRRPLAIASCGNAALAAATLARAADRHLDVFVPDWADQAVLDRLAALGAKVTVSSREPGERGDPCVRQFRAAVHRGSVPFSCQGTDNALALDGGRTLGWELADQLGGRAPDHLVLQAGGGALASCAVRALDEAKTLGALDAMPMVHVVQADGAAPLVRAWVRLARIASESGWEAAVAEGASHPADFMWPWAHPRSVATGILDDETYDWLDVVRGVARSGGSIITVSDEEMVAAADAASGGADTAIGPTGAAGYAGVRALRREGFTGTFAVVLTGST